MALLYVYCQLSTLIAQHTKLLLLNTIQYKRKRGSYKVKPEAEQQSQQTQVNSNRKLWMKVSNTS